MQLALGLRASRVARVFIVDDPAWPRAPLLAEFEGTVVVATPREGARQDYWMEKRLAS